jgi:hypothetical protein
MTNEAQIPVFAVVGHPNEGKSSVVSTLAEDDSVRIDAVPGTTMVCENYPVIIDGVEVLRFTDTPGFQFPGKTLNWFREFTGQDDQLTASFIAAHRKTDAFRDECELLEPISRGAGVIYVVDGSRPIRRDDRAEMDILRLTGSPRMALINCKEDEQTYLESWKSEFRKHFNIIRVFNAHRASYRERIDLLEGLKAIDQDWQPALGKVIDAFKADWDARNIQTARLVVEMLTRCLQYRITKTYADEGQLPVAKEHLKKQYRNDIEKIEGDVHRQIRKRFKHNIFQYTLPPDAIVDRDLFDKRTWQVLGLTTGQLALAAGIAGGVLGGVLDTAAAGLTFGIFTAIGGIAGAGSALLGTPRMAKTKVIGVNIGGIQLQVGPNENIQFPYVMLDRAFIFYSRVINWAHGRRPDQDEPADLSEDTSRKIGYTSKWSEKNRRMAGRFFKNLRKTDDGDAGVREFCDLVKKTLDDISREEQRL